LGNAVAYPPPSEPPASAALLAERERGAQPGRPATPLRVLDDLVCSQRAGVVFVRGDAAVLAAVAGHAERRARATARPLLTVGGASDDAWRDLADRVGARRPSVVARREHPSTEARREHPSTDARREPPSTDPVEVAACIAASVGAAIVVVRDGTATEWGSCVAEEMARIAGSDASFPALFVVIGNAVAAGPPTPPPAAERVWELTIGAAMGSDALLWWEALARDGGLELSRLDRLDTLDRWWSVARTIPADAVPALPALSPAALALVTRLELAQRSWPASGVDRLGTRAALPELLAARLVEVLRAPEGEESAPSERAPTSWIALTPSAREIGRSASADAAVCFEVARALTVLWPNDPWALARASELFARAGRHQDAEAAIDGAITGVTDVTVRADVWRRWEATLAAMPREGASERALRAANLALRVGDADRALSFSKHAAAGEGATSSEVMLALGRATASRGDLITAAIALGKAMERAGDAASRARVDAELAEVRYTQGDFEAAARHAELAIASAAENETRLLARNTLGKLLLAKASWAEAEQHFASDACDASCVGDAVAELRARLNRAICLLSTGRHAEARALLESVLADGEALGELRAVAFAYSNLAVIAAWRHDYAASLDYCERAIAVRRRVGDRVGLASIIIANLAELRLRVGLVAEAEQALIFGRQTCGLTLPPARAAHFALVSARIRLARGQTLQARADVESALSGAGRSSDGGFLCDCHRISARIALEHGDLTSARAATEAALASAVGPQPRAEAVLLSALCARAAGEPFGELAAEALELSREFDHGDTAIEARVLLGHWASIEGDQQTARMHLDAAIALRDRMASSLPVDLRGRYLARRELAEVAKLDATLLAQQAAPGVRVPVSPAGAADGKRGARESRRLVGEDASIRALWSAIQKVGHSDATVLVHGESGTGKELVAEALHDASARRGGPMVKVNCAALVETLLLSELFGHEKGSFTGAAARRRGRFELAEGGTIFLDEIGDISPRTQVALLRVLQDRTFERVGGVTPIRANVRIVCATHRDLKAMVARGEFREDLYYRLRGVVLEVPALRNRLGDLPRIADALLARIAEERGSAPQGLSPRALEVLCRHPWPGNVRELENALRAAALFAEGHVLQPEDFTGNVDGLRHLMAPRVDAPPGTDSGPLSFPPETLRMPSQLPGPPDSLSGMHPASAGCSSMLPPAPSSTNALDPLVTPTAVAYARVREGVSLHDMKRQIEEECIARALAESKGNITKAATLLGMKRPRLSQLVKQYGLGGASEDG
jgi:DNA-binding NtrC family response regulator/tetratricopeptide (TPR) repeat protein